MDEKQFPALRAFAEQVAALPDTILERVGYLIIEKDKRAGADTRLWRRTVPAIGRTGWMVTEGSEEAWIVTTQGVWECVPGSTGHDAAFYERVVFATPQAAIEAYIAAWIAEDAAMSRATDLQERDPAYHASPLSRYEW